MSFVSLYKFVPKVLLSLCGEIFFKGEYPKNDYYPLYIIHFKCKFKLKKGFVPSFYRELRNNGYDFTVINPDGTINQFLESNNRYNNETNEGHFSVKLINHGKEDFIVNFGDRIAQGVFMKYGITKSDKASGKRNGGLGSTKQ